MDIVKLSYFVECICAEDHPSSLAWHWVLESWEGAKCFWRVCCSGLFRGDLV